MYCLFTLNYTRYLPYNGLSPLPDMPELLSIYKPDGSVFEPYSPCEADGRDYGFGEIVTGTIPQHGEAAKHWEEGCVRRMIEWEDAHPNRVQEAAKMGPPLTNGLPLDLRDDPHGLQ